MKIKNNVALVMILLGSCSRAPENSEMTAIEIVSYHYGHTQEKLLQKSSFPRDIDAYFAGTIAAQKGEELPFSWEELSAAFDVFDEEYSSKTERDHLRNAEAFLHNVSEDPEAIEVAADRLYYKVIQSGNGAVVQEDDLLKATYQASTLRRGEENEVFSTDEPAEFFLSTAIPGLRDGLINIRIGEKRRIFIHPELARGGMDPSASQLLIIDIKAIDATSKTHTE